MVLQLMVAMALGLVQGLVLVWVSADSVGGVLFPALSVAVWEGWSWRVGVSEGSGGVLVVLCVVMTGSFGFGDSIGLYWSG